MNHDVFGNLREWGGVLDKLDEHQPPILHNAVDESLRVVV